MASSRPRNLKVIIGLIVGVAVLCSAIVVAYAATRDSGTPNASSTTSKTTPTKTKTPKATPTTTPTPTRPPVDCTKEKCVALTFDDGPGPDTPKLLDTLKAENVPATFLLVGKAVATYPDTVAREFKEGHSLGVHTWNHPQLTKIPDDKIVNEITSTADAIKKAAPDAKLTFTRPPYGAFNPRVISVLKSLNHAALIWDVDTLDWKHRDPNAVFSQVQQQTKPGSIILMHDIHPTSIQAVPEIIKYLRSQGFTMVTVPELFGGSLTPGKIYFDQNMVRE
ncbi:MAG: polysaccharide deacetylase family protein [Varibaculum cambriense]|nr:polysaccharide deacetylase family protein [Varibaculum cambriense]